MFSFLSLSLYGIKYCFVRTRAQKKKFIDLMFLFLGFFPSSFSFCPLSYIVRVCVWHKNRKYFSHTMSHLFTTRTTFNYIKVWYIMVCLLLLFLLLLLFYVCYFFFCFIFTICVYVHVYVNGWLFAVNFWSIWCNLFQFATFLVLLSFLLLQFQFVVITQKLLNYINLV